MKENDALKKLLAESDRLKKQYNLSNQNTLTNLSKTDKSSSKSNDDDVKTEPVKPQLNSNNIKAEPAQAIETKPEILKTDAKSAIDESTTKPKINQVSAEGNTDQADDLNDVLTKIINRQQNKPVPVKQNDTTPGDPKDNEVKPNDITYSELKSENIATNESKPANMPEAKSTASPKIQTEIILPDIRKDKQPMKKTSDDDFSKYVHVKRREQSPASEDVPAVKNSKRKKPHIKLPQIPEVHLLRPVTNWINKQILPVRILLKWVIPLTAAAILSVGAGAAVAMVRNNQDIARTKMEIQKAKQKQKKAMDSIDKNAIKTKPADASSSSVVTNDTPKHTKLEEKAIKQLKEGAEATKQPFNITATEIGGGYVFGNITYYPNDATKTYNDYSIISPKDAGQVSADTKVKEIEDKLRKDLPTINKTITVKDKNKVSFKTYKTNDNAYNTILLYDNTAFGFVKTDKDGAMTNNVTTYYIQNVAKDGDK